MKIVKISAIWCSSCLVMQKTWKNVKERFPNIDWQDLDLDFDENEVSKYKIGEKLPVLILENNGKEIARLIGEKTSEEVCKWIEENII